MVKILPKWVCCYLTPTAAQEISSAVAAAESKTAGEIVPVIVRRSSVLGNLPSLVAVCLFAIFMAIFETYIHVSVDQTMSWIICGVALIAIMILSPFVARCPVLQRLLMPSADLELQVATRAELEFHRSSIGKTVGATGILIFISLAEHRVVVLADKAISEKLPGSTWQEIVDEIIKSLKRRDLSAGLIRSIEMCGKILTTHFPIKSDDTNELPNELIIKE